MAGSWGEDKHLFLNISRLLLYPTPSSGSPLPFFWLSTHMRDCFFFSKILFKYISKLCRVGVLLTHTHTIFILFWFWFLSHGLMKNPMLGSTSLCIPGWLQTREPLASSLYRAGIKDKQAKSFFFFFFP
jgi:hypothetical protein